MAEDIRCTAVQSRSEARSGIVERSANDNRGPVRRQGVAETVIWPWTGVGQRGYGNGGRSAGDVIHVGDPTIGRCVVIRRPNYDPAPGDSHRIPEVVLLRFRGAGWRW